MLVVSVTKSQSIVSRLGEFTFFIWYVSEFTIA